MYYRLAVIIRLCTVSDLLVAESGQEGSLWAVYRVRQPSYYCVWVWEELLVVEECG